MSLMSSRTESKWIEELQGVRDRGGEFLNALYVHRSIQRALPDANQGDDAQHAVLAIMESGLFPLFSIEPLRQSMLLAFRQSVEFLARVDGLTSSDLRASLIQTLGLVHLLDGVKDNKISIQRDFALYEDTLRKCHVREHEEEKRNLEEKLERCSKLREVFSSRWWFMNGLLVVLQCVHKASTIMADIMDLLTKGLCEDDAADPLFLPHDRYKLLRALPIAMHLYHFLSKRVVAPEPIGSKLMESCFRLVKRYPVVPGVGDYVVLIYVPILGIMFTPGGSYAKDMKRFSPMSLDELDRKTLEHLESEYSMTRQRFQVRTYEGATLSKVPVKVREIHDKLCDDLARFLKENSKWKEAKGSMPLQMCQEAVELSFNILKHLSQWRCGIHELLAWRKSAPTLRESLQSEDTDGYNRIPSRVIRIFQDPDVPLVLEMLVCIDGLAKLFKKSKDAFLVCIEHWVRHAVKIFLEQTCKKRGSYEVDVRRVFHGIEHLKSQILEGRHAMIDAASFVQTTARSRFDAINSVSLVKLRKATEELNAVCQLHPSKPKISSYICGHPGGVTLGVHKATKDLLRRLYVVQEVMKANEHLEKILDFSDMSLREREIEVTGTNHLNKASAVALQLANGAINSSRFGSLEPVFTALSLFDGASQKLLTVYKSQLIFLELKQTAMEGLEVVLDDICKQAMIEAKVHACVTSVGVSPTLWVEELGGVPHRTSHNISCIFQEKTLCLVGYDVDIRVALVNRLNGLLESEYNKILHGLDSKDPTLIYACHINMQILKSAYDWIASHLPLTDWSFLEKEATMKLGPAIQRSIVQKLFHEYHFEMRTKRFKACHWNPMEPFSFKISPHPSTPKISFGDIRNDHSPTFETDDVATICKILSTAEMEDFIHQIEGCIVRELNRFLDLQLDVLLKFLPADLASFHIHELSSRQHPSAIGCLSYIMEQFGSDITESMTWMEPLKTLETMGNALIFLHLLQICLQQHQVTSAIQGCTLLGEIGNLHLKIPDLAGRLETYDSGNPFEMEIRKKKAEEQRDDNTPTRVHLLLTAARLVKEEMETYGLPSNIKNAFSAILFLTTYAQTHANVLNVSYGDGVLWASKLMLQCIPDAEDFEHVDWIHQILGQMHLDDMLTTNQGSPDIRCFLSHAQRVTCTWRHLSQFVLPRKERTNTDKGLPMTQDPPLRGFYGGVAYFPVCDRRRTMHHFPTQFGSLKANLMKNRTFSTGSRSMVGVSSDPYCGSGGRSLLFQESGISLRSSMGHRSHREERCSYLPHRYSE